ncbi:MAG: (d)CMP kinase [Planctomycetota bacterium]|nr:(d)CMP kinase [Planctomycetota bacterium]
MIITIDGPAGSGKSTAARELAKALSVAYLDTGATYRAVTLAALRAGIDLEDEDALADLAGRIDLRLGYDVDGELCVILDGQDVSREIRTADVSDNSHYVARSPVVRKLLVAMQRRVGAELASGFGGVVAEGRDQGSVVFPDADVKFYLDASCEVRAKRRCDEMPGADYEHVLDAIRTRDRRDSTRAVAPLMKPKGAVVIDTTDMNIEEVTAELLSSLK